VSEKYEGETSARAYIAELEDSNKSLAGDNAALSLTARQAEAATAEVEAENDRLKVALRLHEEDASEEYDTFYERRDKEKSAAIAELEAEKAATSAMLDKLATAWADKLDGMENERDAALALLEQAEAELAAREIAEALYGH
jgi:DNA anti-recombination protein RmuC